MSAHTVASAVVAAIAHIVRDARCPAQLDVVPRTLARARELVCAIHRVAMTSARNAYSSLYGTIKHTTRALGYRHAVTAHSPPSPARAYAPAAGAAYVKPEAAGARALPTHAAITPPSRRSVAALSRP